ncbi:MAG: DsrE/DsrF/TusD sulfur relay family protein [Spirochaetaceae bacterium]
MKTLFILNDPPYGTERSYNALRLAGQLVKQEDSQVKLFYIGDAASCAKRGQTTPNGFYNIERMTKGVVAKGAEVGVCGSCMDARGITDEELIDKTHRSSMDELTEWTVWADKVIVF